jgi:predicted RNA-binding protein with PUA-like domain
MPQHCWLVKQEPADYPWAQLVADGGTAWTGVRNFQARNHLRAMQPGEPVLYYHSGAERAVVGLAQVTRVAYPDPTARDGDWVAVDLKPVRALPRPVSLAEIKADPALKNLPLIRQSRLSVMPVGEPEFRHLLALAEQPAPNVNPPRAPRAARRPS